MARPQRFCIFCDGPHLTKEHIYAKWLQPHLPKAADEKNHADLTVFIKNTDGTEDRTSTLRSGEGHEGTARIVCKNCNGGWMSALQADAKPFLLPMLQGKSLPLFVKQLRALGGWAAMFCMVNEARRGDARFIVSTREERRYLMESRVAPPTWRVWAGFQPNKTSKTLVSHVAVKVVANDHDGAYIPTEELIIPNTAATTFWVGPVLFHCFRSHEPKVVLKQEVEALARIYPIKRTPVIWPPQPAVDDAAAELISTAFTRRLKNLRVLGLLDGAGEFK